MSGERRTTFAKAYGMKPRGYWGFFGEHVRNMGTYWELVEDMMGTHWEHDGTKEKKSRHFECMLSLPIGCTKFLFPKLFVTIFGLC
jgi:hypothetical protein